MAFQTTDKEIRFIKFLARAARCRIPHVCIETGTYRGDGAEVFARHFKQVHTIELSEEWYRYSSERLSRYKNVHCHHGDSVELLPDLLSQHDEPVLFLLDAHYAGGTTALGKEEVPLLGELEVICKRGKEDIVIIDDVRLLGTKGVTGVSGDPIYPSMEYDWSHITREKISSIIGKQCAWVYHMDRAYVFLQQSSFKRSLFKNISRVLAKVRHLMPRTIKRKDLSWSSGNP